MSKYSTIKCVNGNFAINTETSNLTQAIIQFHDLARQLWNAPDVKTAKIAIMDEQLNIIDRYVEYIYHESESNTDLEINTSGE